MRLGWWGWILMAAAWRSASPSLVDPELSFMVVFVAEGSEHGMCGGALLTPFYVITRAYCVTHNVFRRTFVPAMGTFFPEAVMVKRPMITIISPAKRIELHPDFNKKDAKAPYRDLAVIETHRDMGEGSIKIGAELPTDMSQCIITAFKVERGTGKYKKKRIRTLIGEQNQELVPFTECNKGYFNLPVTNDSQVCTFSRQRKSCIGLAGSLTCNGKLYAMMQLVGQPHCLPNKTPDIHVRVDTAKKWINDCISFSPRPTISSQLLIYLSILLLCNFYNY